MRGVHGATTTSSSGETIPLIAEEAEREAPDRVAAFVPRDGTWVPETWPELGKIRRETAAALAPIVAPGERVALISQSRWEWGPIDLAILSLGATTVGIYPTSTPQQVDYILRHSKARVVVVEDGAQLERLRDVLRAIPEIRRVIAIVPVDGDGATSLEALRAEGREALRATPSLVDERAGAVRPADIATLVYTSGTTGPPKAVALSHAACIATSRTGVRALGARSDDVAVAYLPMAHVLTRVNYYGYLQVRGTAWYSASLERVNEAWLAAQPTVVAAVPRVLEKAQAKIIAAVQSSRPLRRKLFARALTAGLRRLDHVERGQPVPAKLAAECALWERLVYRKVRARLGWSRVRFAMCGGAPIRPDVVRFFHALGVTVIEGFGMTETASPITLNLPVPGGWRIGTVGRPLAGIDVEIAGDGEILVRSPGLFTRYDGDDEATRAAFDERGYFRTGDIGTLDADGFLRITDRKRDLIITSGGKNVSPQNIEALIREDGRVSQAAVFGEGRPYLVALVTLQPEVRDELGLAGAPDGPLPAESRAHVMVKEIVERANRGLAPYETIKTFRVLAEDFTVENDLLTPTLKVKRRAVGTRYAQVIDALYGR